MTALLPAQLLYVAAQFASNDEYKEVINSINVKRNDDTITIISTDGHRAFKVSFEMNEQYHMDEEELNIHFKAFKKRVAKARYVRLSDNIAEFRDVNGQMLSMQPIQHVSGTYPNFNTSIWPDTYQNNPEEAISFNAKYLADFLTEISRFSDNGNVIMQTNTPRTPLQFNGTLEVFGDLFEAFYLLMPVMIRK